FQKSFPLLLRHPTGALCFGASCAVRPVAGRKGRKPFRNRQMFFSLFFRPLPACPGLPPFPPEADAKVGNILRSASKKKKFFFRAPSGSPRPRTASGA